MAQNRSFASLRPNVLNQLLDLLSQPIQRISGLSMIKARCFSKAVDDVRRHTGDQCNAASLTRTAVSSHLRLQAVRKQ